jgi:Ca-activated chloride channel homolog
MKSSFLILMTLTVFAVSAQEEYGHIREGNKLYQAKKFTEAEVAYRRGLERNPKSFEAAYNLGNALFRQEKFAEALEQFQRIAPDNKASKDRLASALHNAGNALLKQQKVTESIEAYKQSLKLRPGDDETRYNLAYAQQLLKQQQQPKQPQPKDNQDQESQQKEKQKKEDQSQQKQEEMSKQRAEQILQALMQEERETMEKAKKQPQTNRKGAEKDW